jgi:DNA polymerase III delta prime subunit
MDYKLILQKMIFKKDSPNLILSGTDKIDKLSILSEYLTKIDKTPPLSLEKYNIKWISNTTYKIFDMNHIKYKQQNHFFSIITEIISSKNYYNNFYRIIVLNNFDIININIQNKFRVIFEKFRATTLFIIITSRLNSIIDPVISRFLLIRISDISHKEKRKISRKYLEDLSYDKKSIIYDKIYTLANEKDILFYSQVNNGILRGHQTIHDKIYQKIISFNSGGKINKKTLIGIKELSYTIEKYNLKNFHKELFLSCLNDFKLSYSVIFKICKLIAECEYNYHKSFNTILSIENCILTLVHILNETTGNR